MKPLNLETEVQSRQEGVNFIYTVTRGGESWSVTIPMTEFDKFAKNPGAKMQRRNFLARMLTEAMQGEPN